MRTILYLLVCSVLVQLSLEALSRKSLIDTDRINRIVPALAMLTGHKLNPLRRVPSSNEDSPGPQEYDNENVAGTKPVQGSNISEESYEDYSPMERTSGKKEIFTTTLPPIKPVRTVDHIQSLYGAMKEQPNVVAEIPEANDLREYLQSTSPKPYNSSYGTTEAIEGFAMPAMPGEESAKGGGSSKKKGKSMWNILEKKKRKKSKRKEEPKPPI